MHSSGRPSFGTLLQQFRRAAGLSQAELARRAGLSPRGISDLERGVRRSPYSETARRLAAALGLDDEARERLLASRTGVGVGRQPTPMSSAEPSFRLPPELTSFIGRSVELDGVADRLASSPLVTIAGPGGAGKTRLALELARRSLDLDDYRDGIVLVELAAVGDGRMVAHAVAHSLGLNPPTGQALIDVVVRGLGSRRLLLVLDNCEHVLSASAELATRLLLGCPHLRLLTTSREPLHVHGEVVFRIPPLALPADDGLETLLSSEAVRLFVQRAQAASAGFALTEINARSVAEICRRLDGLPLAIELAAARVAAFAPADIAGRLDHALHIVADGPRTAPTRQQTLEAALSWSYTLLEEDERRLFQRLSVFVGGFMLESAQAVADCIDATDASDAAIQVLARLVARSMVQVEPQPDGSVRYRLLEPLRQFAHARLSESGNLADVRTTHARHMLALVERSSYVDGGRGRMFALEQLSPDTDNLRVALEWSIASGDADTALRMGAALWVWWSRPDRQALGRARLEQLLALPGATRDPRLHGQLLAGRAFLAMLQGDMAVAVAMAEHAETIAASTGDQALLAIVLRVRGTALSFLGQPAAAEELLTRAIDIAGGTNAAWIETQGLATLGHLAFARGDLARAEALAHEALRRARAGRDPWTLGMALNNLGDLLRAQGAFEQAGSAYDEALSLFTTLDPNRKYTPQGLLHNLGYVALGRGDPARAAGLFLQSADKYRAEGTDRRGLAESTIGLACTAVRPGQPQLAAHLFGSADAELTRLGTLLTAANHVEYQRGLAELRKGRDAAQVAAWLAEGQGLPMEDVLDHARELPGVERAPAHSAASATRGVDGLTRRELEVARLLARGLSNRQVADTLVIGEKTAKNHVHQVLDKLDLHSRAELAARAADLGLKDL